MADKTYKKPILSSICEVIGVACFLLGAGGFIWVLVKLIGIEPGLHRYNQDGSGPLMAASLCLFFSSIICFGIAQAIDFLGRTADNTSKSYDVLQKLDDASLQEHVLARRHRKELLDTLGAIGSPTSVSYYLEDNPEEPVSLSTLNEMYSTGGIDESTPVFREGDSDWSTYVDFME
jgi:hypothetical protein